MAEKRYLVQSFSELRQAMLVIYEPCGYCGGSHRSMLMKHGTGEQRGLNAVTGDFELVTEWWLAADPLKCMPKLPFAISRLAIEAKKVWRIDVGLEATTKKRELVDAGPKRERR